MNPRSDRYVICPACQALNGLSETSCEHCGAPVGEAGAVDQIVTQRAAAETEITANKPRSRPILLIGLWIIFLPNFVASVYSAIFLARHHHRDGLAEFIIFWGSVGMAFLSFVILYWVTRSYFKPSPRQ